LKETAFPAGINVFIGNEQDRWNYYADETLFVNKKSAPIVYSIYIFFIRQLIKFGRKRVKFIQLLISLTSCTEQKDEIWVKSSNN